MGPSLLDLYESVLVSILEEWIHDADLCYLDTAVCCLGFRSHFLLRLKKCKIVNVSIKENYEEYFEWIERRSIDLRSLNLTAENLIGMHFGLRSILTRNKRLDVLVASTGSVASYLVQNCNIDVLSCKITGPIVENELLVVLKCPSLSELTVSDSQFITDHAIECIALRCPGLKCLDVPTAIDMALFVNSCQSLTALSCGLGPLDSLTPCLTLKEICVKGKSNDKDIMLIADCCPNLKGIDVQGMDITDAAVKHLVEKCPQLSTLVVLSKKISDGSLLAIASASIKLITLKLHRAIITDDGMAVFLPTQPQMTAPHLSNSELLTDLSLELISQYCKNLDHLVVDDCECLSGVGLAIVLQECNRMECVSYQGVSNCNDVAMQMAKNLDCLYISNTNDNDDYTLFLDNVRHWKRLTISGLDWKNEIFVANPFLCVIEVHGWIEDGQINKMLTLCPRLERISLDSHRVTSAIFPYLSQCLCLTRFGIIELSIFQERTLLFW